MVDHRVSRAWAWMARAEDAARRGRSASAARMLQAAGGVFRRRGRLGAAAQAAALQGWVLKERGDHERGKRVLGHARALLAEAGTLGLDDKNDASDEREACERARSLIDGADRVPRDRASRMIERPVDNLTALHIACIRTAESAGEGAVLQALCAWLHQRLSAASTAIWGLTPTTTLLASAGERDRGMATVVREAAARPPDLLTDSRHEPRLVVPVGEETKAGAIGLRWRRDPDVDRALSVAKVAATLCEPELRFRTGWDLGEEGDGPHGFVGASHEMHLVYRQIERAARAGYPVLITGETGVGKELVARAVHRGSPRAARTLCAVNCAALSDELFEAELFGHARGAFTGAVGERTGLVESAHRGTLFLDEVGELSPRAQAKLLRVVQEGELRRVGENAPRRVDVQLIAATNRDLTAEVRGGRFREDLLFRLAVVSIEVPPLRLRLGDVDLLARRFWRQAMERGGKRAVLSSAALRDLAAYRWPGNVRELQNVIASLAAFAPRRGTVGVDALPARVREPTSLCQPTLADARLDFERRFVKAALRRTAGRPTAAARELGISRQGLAKLLKRVGQEPSGSAGRAGHG